MSPTQQPSAEIDVPPAGREPITGKCGSLAMQERLDSITANLAEAAVRERIEAGPVPGGHNPDRAPFDAAALFDASPVPAWIVDAETCEFLCVNRATCAFFGNSESEMLALTLPDMCVGEDRVKCVHQMRGGAAAFDFDNVLRQRKRDGTMIYVVASRHPTEFAGKPAVLSILNDITERRRQEHALEENEALLRAVLDNSTAVISLKDPDGRYILVNREFERVSGRSAALALGKRHDEVFESGMAEAVERNHRIVIQSGSAQQFEECGVLDGRAVTYISNRFPLRDRDGRIYAVCGISTDITKRKKDEAAQRFLADATAALAGSLNYEETLHRVARLAVPQIADWCVVDMVQDDGTVQVLAVEHVDPAKRELGYELRREYPPDPAAKRGLYNVLKTCASEIYPEITDEALVSTARDARQLEVTRALGLRSVMQVPIVSRDGVLGAITFVTTSESGYVYTQSDLVQAEALAARAALAIENARLYRAAQTEIAERARIQSALTRSEERFRFALANTEIAVYTQDEQLRYTWAYNGATSSELDEIYGKTDAEILDSDQAALLTEIKRRVLETGVEERHTVAARRIGKELRYYDTSFAPVRDAAGSIVGVTGTVHDVTMRKAAEEELMRHQAEIEALNVRLQRAMSETHHRVKNNLQVVAALLEMEEMRHEAVVPISEVSRLRQHITSLSTIHDMLTHQAKVDADVYDLPIAEALERLVPLLQGLAPGRNIVTSIESMRLPVRQGTTLAIIVNELISNAVKHGRGEIAVRLESRLGMATLEVSDCGSGFGAQFDPTAAGTTGLELIQALVHMDLQGEMQFENALAGGAQVLVRFPVQHGTDRPS